MKYKLLTTALLISLPFFLTACTLSDLPVIGKYIPSTPTTTGPTKLTVQGLWESPEVMDSVIKKYEAANSGVTISYDDRSIMKSTLKDYKAGLVNRLQQTDAPDIVLVHNTWVNDLKNGLAPAPANVLDAATYTPLFYPIATDSAVIADASGKKSVYAVPLYYDGLALVYNKKHFAAINQMTAPTAWTEFENLAVSLKGKGVPVSATVPSGGAALGTADNIDYASDIYGLMLVQTGVTDVNTLDSKAAADALAFYTGFAKQDGVWGNAYPEASLAFAREQVSMIFSPSYNLLDIINARPDLEIGVAPVPQVKEDTPVTWGSFWMFAVSAGSKNKEAAWKFLKYMTQEDTQLSVFSEASKFRKYGAPYSLVSLAPQLSSQEFLAPIVNTAPYAKSFDIASRSGDDIEENAIKTAINAVLTGQTPDVALKAAKQTILSGK